MLTTTVCSLVACGLGLETAEAMAMDTLVAAGGPTLALPVLPAFEAPVPTGAVPMVMRVAPDEGPAGVGAPSAGARVGEAVATDTATDEPTDAAMTDVAANDESTPEPATELFGGGGGGAT
jgi:hypothetical protein